MKKTLLTFLLGTITLFAQEKLVVDYKFNYDFDTSKVQDKKKLDFYTANNNHFSYFQLITSYDEAYFGKIQKIDNNQKSNSNVLIMEGPAGNFYTNLKDKYSLFSIDLNGKKLIVKDSLKALNWNLTKEKDKILGYEVKKAIYHKDKFSVEAWYAPSLNFKNGPNKYYGLPGIILKVIETVESKDGYQKQIYTATEVKIDNTAKIEIPTKGKIVTQEEFYKIIDDMNKKFEEISNNKVEK
jgi:GLPGLI family protein